MKNPVAVKINSKELTLELQEGLLQFGMQIVPSDEKGYTVFMMEAAEGEEVKMTKAIDNFLYRSGVL